MGLLFEACAADLNAGFAERCFGSLYAEEPKASGDAYRLTCTPSDPFFVRTCKDMPKVMREIERASRSEREDQRTAAATAMHALIVGDRRRVWESLHLIDPPCAFLFDYTMDRQP